MKKYLSFVCFVLLVACKQDNEEIPVVHISQTPSLSAFVFEKANNPQLTSDVTCLIKEGEITAFIPSLKSVTSLVPTFSGKYEKVEVDGKLQVSGVSNNDFSSIITYQCIFSSGRTTSYEVHITVFTKLPIVSVTTDNNQPITSKDDYVAGTMTVSKTLEFDDGYEGRMRIKGRGNATWYYEKKPYKIKLDISSEILGMPSDKEWVLLADYCDKTLMRTGYGFILGKLAGLPWTPRFCHVEYFLNGVYEGTYTLCEQVKVAANRANAAKDGYLIERDNYWNLEPLWFTTSKGHHYTFKYPDTDDLTVGDEKVTFINHFMNEMEDVLYSNDFKDPNIGYRKYMDADVFARWFLIQEVLGNIDTNPYFVLESRTARLQVYPLWDFEWSLGLAAIESNGWATPPVVSPIEIFYWKNNVYFDRLFQDPYFTSIVKNHWETMKNEWIPALYEAIDKEQECIKYAQKENFRRWDILGKYVSVGLVAFPTWQEELDYTRNFLKKRVIWLNNQINGL
jgi:hypothetical protein